MRRFASAATARAAWNLRWPQRRMNLRITTKQRRGVTVVQVDGDLDKQGVTEFEKACASITGPLCLDLANLQSIDAAGVHIVQALEDRGAAVTGVSPYIQKLLERAVH
jgi:anti-anti-sigma factor